MNLTFSYDQAADVLDIRTGRAADGAITLEEPALDLIALETAGENDQYLVGVIMIFAASYMAPHFRLRQENAPPRAGNPEHTRYDRGTDTLTWGVTVADPEMISQAGDLIAYWQPDQEYDDSFEPIGLSLRNAAKHLAPWFVPVEPPAGG